MTPKSAMILGTLKHNCDQDHWLVLADWLEDHDDPLASMIRQVMASKLVGAERAHAFTLEYEKFNEAFLACGLRDWSYWSPCSFRTPKELIHVVPGRVFSASVPLTPVDSGDEEEYRAAAFVSLIQNYTILQETCSPRQVVRDYLLLVQAGRALSRLRQGMPDSHTRVVVNGPAWFIYLMGFLGLARQARAVGASGWAEERALDQFRNTWLKPNLCWDDPDLRPLLSELKELL